MIGSVNKQVNPFEAQNEQDFMEFSNNDLTATNNDNDIKPVVFNL